MSSSDFPADTAFEDWEEEEIQTYGESVAERTAGFGAAIAILFYVLITFTFLWKCCCVKWKAPSGFSSDTSRNNFTICMAICIIGMVAALVPISIGSVGVVESGSNIIHRTADLTIEVDEQLMCGVGDATANGDVMCLDGTLGEYLQEIYLSVEDALDTTIDQLDNIEANLTTTLDDVEAELLVSKGILEDMDSLVDQWETDIDIMNEELTALQNTDNTELADFSFLPDSSDLPDASSFASTVDDALVSADDAIASTEDAIDEVDAVINDEFGEIRTDYGDDGSAREDMLGILEDLFDELVDVGGDLVTYNVDITDAGDTYDESTSSTNWASIILFAIAPITAALGAVCAYGCGRGKYSSFMTFNAWSCCFGLEIAVLMGIFGAVTVIVGDVCDNDTTLMTTNVDVSFDVGNTTVVVPDVIVGVLTCPSKPDDGVATPENNLVDILGIIDEFNFTDQFAEIEVDFDESKDIIDDMRTQIDDAKDALGEAAAAVDFDVRNGYDPTDITDPMLEFREQYLPPYPIDLTNSTQMAWLLTIYDQSPTLDAATSGGVSDFFTEFQVEVNAVNTELGNLVNVPSDYASSYTLATSYQLNLTVLNNEFWRDADASGEADAIPPPTDPQYGKYARYGSAGGYAALQAEVTSMEAFQTALDSVEQTNNMAKMNATQVVDAANDIDSVITQIEAKQVELSDSIQAVNASLNMIDDGHDNGFLTDSINVIDNALDAFGGVIDAALEVNGFAFCGVIGDYWRDAWETETCEGLVGNGTTVFYGGMINILFMFMLLLLNCCFMPAHYYERHNKKNNSFDMTVELEMNASK